MARRSAFDGFGEPFDGAVPSVEEVTRAALESSARAARPAKKRQALSVSAAVRAAKDLLSAHSFRIVGEVSELSDKPGYKAVYFTVKDEDASLPCLMWKSRYAASGVPLTLGAKVEITGKFTIFAPKGRMNFDVSSLVLAGDGDLRARVARLAAKLQAEGLMAQERKRALPAMPQVIGLVTSPRGAAVHDVLRTLRRRYPLARVVFAGVAVEGKNAPRDLVAALDRVAHSDAEVVLLVRGGGSFEDLMPFNDEALARAIALCPVPVVTGIGHEPDTSIADMVADLRASTPTAAAEAASPSFDDLGLSCQALSERMTRSLRNRLNRSESYLEQIASRPLFKDPESLFAIEAQSLDSAHERMSRVGSALLVESVNDTAEGGRRLVEALPRFMAALRTDLSRAEGSLGIQGPLIVAAPSSSVAHAADRLRAQGQMLLSAPLHRVALAEKACLNAGENLLAPALAEAALAASRLNDLSPLHILERGWSIARDAQGAVLKSVADVEPDERITVQLKDGSLACRVEDQAVAEMSEMISWED